MNTNTNIARASTKAPERVQQRVAAAPLVDVYENQNELLVVADVPGVAKEDVTINLEKGLLSIDAKRPGHYDYFRAFLVPQGVDTSKIDAELKSGVLRVRLPK